MNDVALLVAALEGHGIRLSVRGASIDVEADAREVEREPIELLDELTRDKAAVLEYLSDRETPPVPVRVIDKRDAPEPVVSSPSPLADDPRAERPCEYDAKPHRHDPQGGECLTPEGHQALMPSSWPGWRDRGAPPVVPTSERMFAMSRLGGHIARMRALADGRS